MPTLNNGIKGHGKEPPILLSTCSNNLEKEILFKEAEMLVFSFYPFYATFQGSNPIKSMSLLNSVDGECSANLS